MRPAFSVLFLTTLIGAGQGLLIAMVTGQIFVTLGGGPEVSGGFFAGGGLLALILLGLGLVASMFHLANPQRGWRAASRWRTSWLSREVILIPLLCGLVLLYALAHLLSLREVSLVLGLLSLLVCLALFVCTGMIYACVRFIRQWASAWTVVNYLMMGLASGFTLAAGYAGLAGSALAGFLTAAALALTLAALAARLTQLWLNARGTARSCMKTAIGTHHTQIRQITQGFMGQSFNTQEFFTPGGAEAIRGLTLLFILAGFVAPLGLIVLGVPVVAFVIQFVGLMAERWVFFAAGEHVQNLYYQAKA
ncbi:DMSO reductase anchor subunit [Candidatus Terasakiella magnetica]|nr:DMSO reductase anchor subunit [Candidatus Terasakiella magnetica]